MPKVSVIIPIYNVASYIKRCLHSLFSQTLEEIEFIFINDATPDKSIEILKETLIQYPHRQSQVRIINHEQNLGVAAARTSGIKTATGEYVIHCDPDDYVEVDMYERMYNLAIEKSADIITCDHFRELEGRNSIQYIYYLSDPKKCLINWFNKKRNGNYSMLWDKLVRRQIIMDNKIYPYENINFGEDFGCVVRFFYYSKSIVSLHIPLYHYCQRKGSCTETPLTLKRFKSRIQLVENICEFLTDPQFHHFCLNLKFNIKLSSRHLFKEDNKYWYNLYKDTHRHILSFQDNSLKSRLLWIIALSDYNIYCFLKRNLRILN